MESESTEASSRKRSSTQPIDAPQTLVGRILDGRYRLERVLNAGGMGIVFEATQLSVGRMVAIKVLKPTLAADSALIKRFSMEVEVVASLSHPNIVSLVDSGQDASGLTYLVMDFVEGVTFRESLRQTRLTLGEILEVFRQICDALIEIHGCGIIHRDLKFDNIMILRLRDGRLHVKLLDFGVAKLLSRDVELTRSGQVAGTPGIVAPELVDGATPTPRSDLYSLGVLLFTALSGDAPFRADNELELMRAHKTMTLPDLKGLVGRAVPDEIIDLAYALLEKDPQDRPRDTQQVRDRLEFIIRNLARRYPDATAYRPPTNEGFEPEVPQNTPPEVSKTRARVDRFEAQFHQLDELRPGIIGRVFKEPIVAPFTVVAALGLILIVLLVAILYMVYHLFVQGVV